MPSIANSCGWAGALRLAAVLSCAVIVGACGGSDASRESAATPTSPTALTADTGPAAGAARGASAGGGAGAPVGAHPGPVPGFRPSLVEFPPRDESFAFRSELEQIYRTELGRTATATYVDAEGELVWTQEYLRYRVNGCGHLDAAQKVFAQIDQGSAAAVCRDVPGGRPVAFPPRNESFDFRLQLEVKYRDGLRREPSSSAVDLEGASVWTQEYLRYRANACDDVTARAAVHTQIRGGPAPPVCIVVAPEPEVLGHWRGTIAMPTPRPFTMDITTERGGRYFGTYRDIAFGTVSLDWDGEDRVHFFVYFGDGSGTFDGQFIEHNRIRGSMKYDKIATTFSFEMFRD